MRRKHSGRRRSAAQWAQLLASWNRNTTTAADFAKRLGVSRGTLAWWCWRLKHSTVALPSGDDSLRFVRVDVEREAGSLAATDDWELTSTAGHTLRVRGRIGPELPRLVLDHMTPRRAR